MYPYKSTYSSSSRYRETSDSSSSSSRNVYSSDKYSSRLMCSGGIFRSTRSRFNINAGNWHELPEDILLAIFVQLKLKDLLSAARTCKHWNSVSTSDYLWMRFFQLNFQQDSSIPLSPRATGGWRSEYERLFSQSPLMQCEVLRDHRSFVLHVSFANAGDMFATVSFDAQVMVWSTDYPAQLIFQANLQRRFAWKFASFSQFNSSDTMLLVSGAYFGTGPFLTAGEVVIFDLENNFRLLSRTKNRPYDLFGAWITDDNLITGDLKWLQNLRSASTLMLTRATQETSSELVPIFLPLFNLFNNNSSCARCVMVARCDPNIVDKKVFSVTREVKQDVRDIAYCPEYYEQMDQQFVEDLKTPTEEPEEEGEDRPLTPPHSLDDEEERLVIFTTGDKTYSPHQIGIIRHQPHMPEVLYVEHDIQELTLRQERRKQRIQNQPRAVNADYEAVQKLCHSLDYTINVGGSIVGMALSPDHRHLYVNSHPWSSPELPISPVNAPAIGSHVDTHVIDLVTMEQVGCLVFPIEQSIASEESYYIFPSVSHHYVARGGNSCGLLFDRHYGLCLAGQTHGDSVSCVALNPADPEMAVSVSDDKTIKVWRSRRVAQRHRIARAVEGEILQPALRR